MYFWYFLYRITFFTIPIMVPKPTRAMVLGEGFGPQTPIRQSDLHLFCELLDLYALPFSSFSYSFFTHTPSFTVPTLFPIFLVYFPTPPLPLMSDFSLLIQSLLSDALIIIVSPIHMHLHFHQNPKKPLCLLRILFKLVPSAKQRSVASSLKALTTLGNQLESNHFIITFAPPHQSIVDQTLQATLER